MAKQVPPILGVDEVGRGCLAGPVYAGAVIFRSRHHWKLINDSKMMSEFDRERVAPLIYDAHYVGIGFASVEEIDDINILQASFLAMKRAIADLIDKAGVKPGHVLVDGHMEIPGLKFPQTPIVDGDATKLVIGAASIVAKVARDRVMKQLGVSYPGYGFENHKGYAVPSHRRAIKAKGPCVVHRRSFSGVYEWGIGVEAAQLPSWVEM